MTSWLLNGLHNLYLENPIFESSDPTTTKFETTEILKEHQLTWRRGKVDSALRCTHVGELSFMLLRYGAAVHVAPGALHDFYLFQVPIHGKSSIGVGNQTVVADRHTATVISPDLPLQLDWEQDCEQLLIKIPKPLLNQACTQLLDIAPEDQIEFQPRYCLNNSHGIAWQHQISAMLSYAAQKDYLPEQWLQNLQTNLLQHLLITQPNNYSKYFHHTPRMTGQRRLRLARRYIHEHLGENLRLEGIAQACDSSIRSLTDAFRTQLDISPTQYIREARLAAVRKELLQATPTTRITEVATRWGFTHLGRFSAWYKESYQESPLETLNK